jgi:hypothetical protein
MSPKNGIVNEPIWYTADVFAGSTVWKTVSNVNVFISGSDWARCRPLTLASAGIASPSQVFVQNMMPTALTIVSPGTPVPFCT